MIRVTAMAQVILHKLHKSDSVIIACVNFERNGCIDVLYSTRGNCDFDLARLLSDCTSDGKHLISGAFRDDELLGVAVNNSFQLFGSNSPSVPHIFLVSANRDTTLNTTYNTAVGFLQETSQILVSGFCLLLGTNFTSVGGHPLLRCVPERHGSFQFAST